MSQILQQLSTMIAMRRRQRHLKQADLATAAMVSLKTVTNIETSIDKHDIGIQKVLRILRELDIAIELKAVKPNTCVTVQVNSTVSPTIPIEDFPQLKLLTWNRSHDGMLNEVEAFELYERNWRHIDEANLINKEQNLIERLTRQYGNGVMNV